MYEYLKARGYDGPEHSLAVCIEANNRGFQLINWNVVHFITQPNQYKGDN